MLLDKTGTVTTGEPSVVKIFGTRNVPEKFLLSMAAGLELRSEHPLARAILQRAEKDHLSYATVTDFEAVPGKVCAARSRARSLRAAMPISSARPAPCPTTCSRRATR